MSRQSTAKKAVATETEVHLPNDRALLDEIPPEIRRHLNPPTILPNEDAAEYWSRLITLGKEFGAKGLFDWLKVQSLAEVLWARKRWSILLAEHFNQPRPPSTSYRPSNSPPKQFEPEAKLSADKVNQTYFKKVSTLQEGTEKDNLVHWFHVSQGGVYTPERYSPEFGLERLAELVGVKPDKASAPPPYEPPVEPPEEQEARWRAARLKSAESMGDQIARLDRQAQLIFDDICRNLLFSLKIQELLDHYSAEDQRRLPMKGIGALPSEPRQVSTRPVDGGGPG